MPFNCEGQLIFRNASTVITYIDPRNSAVENRDLNTVGARVNGVLHQFFQSSGGAFDYFPGCDPINGRRVESSDDHSGF